MYSPYAKNIKKSKQALEECTVNFCGTFSLSGKSFASGSETTYGKTYAHNINYFLCMEIDTQPREIYSIRWLWLWKFRAINRRAKTRCETSIEHIGIEHLGVIANNWTVSMRKRFPKHLRACVSVRINKLLNIVAIPWWMLHVVALWPLRTMPTDHRTVRHKRALAFSMAMTSNSSRCAPFPSPLSSNIQFSMPCRNCSTRMLCCCCPCLDTSSGHTFKDLWQNANK